MSESAANFNVEVPHSHSVKAAIEKLQGAGGSQVHDLELIDVVARFRCKVDVAFTTRDVTGTVNVDGSHVGLALDVSGWVPGFAHGIAKDKIEADLKEALE